MNEAPADILRDEITSNVLPTYLAAGVYQEDTWPFTKLEDSIIYCRDQGGDGDEDILNSTTDFYIFSKANANPADIPQLKADAKAAYEHLLREYRQSCIFGINGIQGVTGEFLTGQNRYYFRFSVQTLANT